MDEKMLRHFKIKANLIADSRENKVCIVPKGFRLLEKGLE